MQTLWQVSGEIFLPGQKPGSTARKNKIDLFFFFLWKNIGSFPYCLCSVGGRWGCTTPFLQFFFLPFFLVVLKISHKEKKWGKAHRTCIDRVCVLLDCKALSRSLFFFDTVWREKR